MATPTTTIVTCEPKPALQDRPPISQPEAHRLAATFKMLANDSRLRLLHALARAGELCVTDLAAQAGMRAPAVSNQLARLVDQHILVARRDGNRIYYRIEDPCVTQLLVPGRGRRHRDPGEGGAVSSRPPARPGPPTQRDNQHTAASGSPRAAWTAPATWKAHSATWRGSKPSRCSAPPGSSPSAMTAASTLRRSASRPAGSECAWRLPTPQRPARPPHPGGGGGAPHGCWPWPPPSCSYWPAWPSTGSPTSTRWAPRSTWPPWRLAASSRSAPPSTCSAGGA